jgi:hypothetical protein
MTPLYTHKYREGCGGEGFKLKQEGGLLAGFTSKSCGNPKPQKTTPTSHEHACPGRTSSLPLFFFFFLKTILHSTATTYILPRGAQSREITRKFTRHNSLAARSLRFAALRGGSHPAAMFPTREPPQNEPSFPHPSPLVPSLPARPRSPRAAKPGGFQLSPQPPRRKSRLDGCGLCACARRPRARGVGGPMAAA